MNTWDAVHQNAAVFMRNLGPLVKALQKVRRKKRKAVVIHTVFGATAKDGAMQLQNPPLPPLPIHLTLPSPLQGQCSTKFLATLPFQCVCLTLSYPSGYWGLIHSLDPSFPLLCLTRKREKESRQKS